MEDSKTVVVGGEGAQSGWMPGGVEETWVSNSQLALKHILALTGFWVILYANVHGIVKVKTRDARYSGNHKLMVTHSSLAILHSGFCVLSGIYLKYVSPLEVFKDPGVLFTYSLQHDFVSTVTLGYCLASSSFALANAAGLGWDDATRMLAQTIVLCFLTYWNWVFPCAYGIKLWHWWNLAEVGPIATSVVKFSLLWKARPKKLIVAFMVGLILTIGQLWFGGTLVLWAFWGIGEAADSLPDGHPVQHLSRWYIYCTLIGYIVRTFLAYLSFKYVLGLTKEWTETARGQQGGRKQEAKEVQQGVVNDKKDD